MRHYKHIIQTVRTFVIFSIFSSITFHLRINPCVQPYKPRDGYFLYDDQAPTHTTVTMDGYMSDDPLDEPYDSHGIIGDD